jgi:hypothetical protein
MLIAAENPLCDSLVVVLPVVLSDEEVVVVPWLWLLEM